MKIAIFGLGYVGSVSAACLAAAGHEVVGVDVDPHKLSLIRRGRPPVSEPGLDDLMARVVAEGRFTVTDDAELAVQQCELSLVCVGTPSRRNGSLDTTHLDRVIENIGRTLARHAAYHVVAIRSTLLPGVLESRLIPLLQRASGRRVGVDLGVCVNPEFLREGSAIEDFRRPPFTIVGETDRRAGALLLSVYAHIEAPVHRVQPDEASMVKYASNNFHALKVAFANEIGALAHGFGIDGRQVMRVFCQDRELNISPRYLLPGFAFGGSCLPKDLRAIAHAARELDVATPLLGSVLGSNDLQIQRLVDMVLESRKRRVALLGLSFKVGSDDLRESPFVRLAELLLGKGVKLGIYDPDLALDSVFGRNRAYVDEHLPHVGQLVGTELSTVIRDAEIIIVAKRLPDVSRVRELARGDQAIIDLAGIDELGDVIRPWKAERAAQRLAPEPLATPA